MENIQILIGLFIVCAIGGSAIYSRKTYEELVKLNRKLDALLYQQE